MNIEQNKREYQRCVRCVMDTSDPEITFDTNGVCNHCTSFQHKVAKYTFAEEEGQRELASLLDKIKFEGQGKEYDCLIGLSGGVDSSFLALKAKEWGLRPLVIHIDTGWNSEEAVQNINRILEYCGYELYTHVINWEEMRDLQVAFLKSGVSNQDVPQDHAIFANTYHFAVKNNIRTILTGGNVATEGVFPQAWQGNQMDAVNLKAIHKRYGRRSLKSYKTISFYEYYFYYPFVKKLRTIRPLNYIEYNKEKAIKELEQKIGWKNYGRKHGESLFTKIFQNYYQPTKFGFDKRLPHLSSLIMSGQISREEALESLDQPLYEPIELENDISYFCRKLDISREEFDKLINCEIHHYSDFPNIGKYVTVIKAIQNLAFRIFNKKATVYS